MSDVKFTYGPWIASDDDEEFMDFAVFTTDEDFITNVGTSKCMAFDMVRANAHLIATAPEMYDVLLEMKGTLERFDKDFKITNDSLYSDIVYLLQKARGEIE